MWMGFVSLVLVVKFIRWAINNAQTLSPITLFLFIFIDFPLKFMHFFRVKILILIYLEYIIAFAILTKTITSITLFIT